MKKFLCIFLVAMLVVASCVSLIACNPQSPEKPVASVMDGNGNDLSQGTHEVPSRMVFASVNGAPATAAAPVGSTTLTATVSPANATNKKLTWSAAFVNPNSTWANGKQLSTYLTIAPSADTLTCTVTCLQAFGEQIRISVVSQDNASATANCLVDFQKNITGAKLVLVNGSDRKELKEATASPVGVAANVNYNVTVEVEQSLGTVDVPYKVMRKMAAWVSGFPMFGSDAQPNFGWTGDYRYSGIMWNTFCFDRDGIESLYRFSDWDFENETIESTIDSAISYVYAHRNEALIRWHLELTAEDDTSNVLVDKIFYMSITDIGNLRIAANSVSLSGSSYTFNK